MTFFIICLTTGVLLVVLLIYTYTLLQKKRKEGKKQEKLLNKCNSELNSTLIKLETVTGSGKTDMESAIKEMPAAEIPGICFTYGLELVGGDVDLYLSILRSYADNTPAIIDKLRNVTGELLPDYAINIHGLKGSSESIGAEHIWERALILETMAKDGDLAGVLSQNEEFIKEAEIFIENISAWLKELD